MSRLAQLPNFRPLFLLLALGVTWAGTSTQAWAQEITGSPASKKEPVPATATPDPDALRKALEKLPAGASPQEIQRAFQKALGQLQVGTGLPAPDDIRKFRGLGGKGRGESKLGVRVFPPSPTLVDQLDLPTDRGMVVVQIRPGSAADKAGLKVHDILLELDGKPVPNHLRDLLKMVEGIKPNTPIDAVVLRKGKKETVKGLALPEPSADRPTQANPRGPASPPARPAAGPRAEVMTTLFRTGDRFTARHQEGSLVITLTGKVADGKAMVATIQVQDGSTAHTYESLDKVPDQYRDKVKHLADMAEKGSVKIDIKTP